MLKLKFTIGTVTDKGLNSRRTANEDRFLTIPEQGLFVVCDGVGGHRGGQVASQTAVDIFREVFTDRPEGELLALVKETIAYANQSIFSTAHEVADLQGMATTLTVVAIDGMRAIIAHVGDSRVYRFDGKQLFCETEDHSEVNDALRAGTITPEQAENHPHKNIINRALGGDAAVEADFKIVTIDHHTSFLLCSDGITRHVSDEELLQLMRSGQNPNNICEQLKEMCFARGAEDNLTAVIVDCGDRAYIEEATRPQMAKTVVTTSSAPNSRISVDFTQPAVTPEIESNGENSNSKADNEEKKTFISALIQIIILGCIIAAAVYAGMNLPKIKAFVWGENAAATSGGATQIPVAPEVAAARVLFEERRYDKARDSYQKLLEANPGNAEFLYFLGLSQLELRQFKPAIASLLEAAKLNDKLPNIYAHLSLAYKEIGDKKNADEYLKKAASTAVTPVPAPTATPLG